MRASRISLSCSFIISCMGRPISPIHIRLNANNINRDNGTEIPEVWMPTIRKHLNQNQRTPEETLVKGNNSWVEMHQSQQTTMIHNAVPQPVNPIARRRLVVSSQTSRSTSSDFVVRQQNKLIISKIKLLPFFS